MAHVGTRRGTGDARRARVGKKVQHAYFASRPADRLCGEIPIDRLLGEKPRMLEIHGFEIEFQFTVTYLKRWRQFIYLPTSSAA